MKEWRQTITVICTVVLAFAALAALMQIEHATIRDEMRSEHAQIREEMSREHAQMREEANREHAAIRAQLNSIDRRTARIEGHLFGIEIMPDPAEGPDNQRLEFGGIIAAPRAGSVRDMIKNGACELGLLDENNFALRYGHLSETAVIDGLESRSDRTSVNISERYAKPEHCEYADLVSGMRPVKHRIDAGIKAVRGIDF